MATETGVVEPSCLAASGISEELSALHSCVVNMRAKASHLTPLRGKRAKVRSHMTPLRGKACEGEESHDSPTREAREGEESHDTPARKSVRRRGVT